MDIKINALKQSGSSAKFKMSMLTEEQRKILDARVKKNEANGLGKTESLSEFILSGNQSTGEEGKKSGFSGAEGPQENKDYKMRDTINGKISEDESQAKEEAGKKTTGMINAENDDHAISAAREEQSKLTR